MRLAIPISVASLCAASCTALTLEKPEGVPELDLPEVWKNSAKGDQGEISTGWLRTFNDHDMERLVAEALENNFDLARAAAILRAAKEGTIIGRAARFPNVGTSASGARTRTGNGPLEDAALTSDFGLSLDAAWEIDLWGRLRDLDLAARNDYLLARADFRGARLSLAANTAQAWFDLITSVQQIQLAETTLESFARNYRIVERNYKAGDETASPLDVQFARTNVAAAERSLVATRLGRDEAARPLEVLLGRYPSAEIKSRDDLPVPDAAVPAGLPSELLWRRPDLVAAAASLLASAKRADAARKNLLPSLSLTGRGSSSSVGLNQILIDPEHLVWNAAASLAQTLYAGGEPSAAARQALAQNDAAVRAFAAVALQAFREVESALATEHSLAEQVRFLATELKQATLAETQASRDYSEGLVGILEILEAQRRAVGARNSMILLRNQRLQNRVDLHLALGGDFATLPTAPGGG